MEAFEGTWKQIKMDNFDAYLKASGVSLILRKVAGASTPSVEFRNNVNSSKTKDLLQNDGTWTFFFYSTVKNGTWTFKVGEESEEVTPDGRKFMSTITVENGKLYHKQRAIKKGDNDGLITRWVVGDELHTTAEVLLPNGERVTCVAVDKKQ